MRIFSEKRLVALKSDTYVEAQKSEAIGRYGVRMTKKQAVMMDSRRFSLDIIERVNWVEDGFHIVIGQILFSNDSILPYLGLSYPDWLMSENELRTETKEERKTLLFRIRHMLRSLKAVKNRYELFEQWRFSGLEFAMQSFDYIIEQAFGEVAHQSFNGFYRRMRRIWRSVAPELDSEEAVEKELESLIDTADVVFSTLSQCCAQKDAELAAKAALARNMERAAKRIDDAASRVVDTASDIEKATADIRATNRATKKAAATVEKLAGLDLPKILAEEDRQSREAGLSRFNASRRRQIRAAFELSHDSFPVSRNDKKGDHSLPKLAEKTWAQNREEFERLAKLTKNPGYASAHALYCALYRLANNYPEADHFNWIS